MASIGSSRGKLRAGAQGARSDLRGSAIHIARSQLRGSAIFGLLAMEDRRPSRRARGVPVREVVEPRHDRTRLRTCRTGFEGREARLGASDATGAVGEAAA